MAISIKTRKMLWGRSASICAYPECRKPLVEDETEADEPSIIGDEAHIVAREESGPRGISELPIEKRDDFTNLILLCKDHHKLVDDQPNTYTVESLLEMKAQHLKWVRSTLDIDMAKQRDDELYASYVDYWEEKVDIQGWEGWSSFVLSCDLPSISVLRLKAHDELNKYLLGRVWPGRYPELDAAFINFRSILNDFRRIFMKYAIKSDDPKEAMYVTDRFYSKIFHEQEQYYKLLDQFEFHVELVADIMLELTRAANKICDQVRKYLLVSYRLKEGVLLVDYMDGLNFKTARTEYRDGNEEDQRYPGLREFMENRTKRDIYFGEGISEAYFGYGWPD